MMSTMEKVKEFSNAAPVDRIPLGMKDNVYVVVKMERKEGQKDVFPDDTGVWDSTKGTTANHAYSIRENNQLSSVFIRNGMMCYKKVVCGRTTYEKCIPQPERYIIFHRYYCKLKGDHEYKKRITTIKTAPKDLSHFQNMALVEYCGT
ncbi:hypothetical protein SNE40_005891 [Patella caerulea]|uniref:Uncharacterized protein n=1 Tax=Patella caerulea TaxID=87958 RepID=A0AAN8JZ88_PATCE